jgi:ubiquinone/menaquinone biosynthesis C-methylase UbiE
MSNYIDTGREADSRERREYWDGVARRGTQAARAGAYYHHRLEELYRLASSPGLRVLELGSGQGDLLAALAPAYGVGVDFSQEMISRATQRHPHLRFTCADALDLQLDEKFDIIILSDLVNDVWDVQQLFDQVRRFSTPSTRVVMNFFSRVWELPLALAQRAGLAQPLKKPNWLAREDVANLLYLSEFEVIRQSEEILWPLRTPLVDSFFNKFLVRLWPFRHGALANFLVARPLANSLVQSIPAPSVSIIIPARNEAGNVPAIFARTPELGSWTELVFVEGHSSDETFAAIERAIGENPQRKCKLIRQTGIGKGDAVRLGFAQASGDVLMILDADLTMPPEELHRYYDVLASGKAEFANGVRLVYPMEKQAMQFLNLVGNKFFSWAFSWLLGQPVKDTLCGTKVLHRSAYERLAANRSYFGDFDPFGDFDLLFGAAKLNLKIVDIPIRYRQRTYGTTNIDRFKHGLLLLRMTAFAARRLKFV